MKLLKFKSNNINSLIVVLVVLLITAFFVSCGSDDPEAFKEVRFIKAEKLYDLLGDPEKTAIVDIRDKDSYNSAHLLDAFQIEDSNDLPLIIVDKSKQLIIYGSGSNEASFTFAKAVFDMGYKFVYCYKEGVEEWKSLGYYFEIEFEGLMADFYPPDEGEYIVDVLWESSYEAAHIPYAINIPHSKINDNNGNIIDEGKAVTSVIESKEANIVAYCGNPGCPLGLKAILGLMKLGYKNLYYYKEGLEGWRDRGQSFEGVE